MQGFKMNTAIKAKQAGMTLIEMVLVLVIGTGIIAGGVAYYNSASKAANDKDLIAGMTSLQASARAMAAGSGNYGIGSLNGAMITQSRVPGTLHPSGTSISTPGGTSIVVTGATTSFSITTGTATVDECVAMLTNSANFLSYKVGGGSAITAVPADPITANAACATPASVTLTSN